VISDRTFFERLNKVHPREFMRRIQMTPWFVGNQAYAPLPPAHEQWHDLTPMPPLSQVSFQRSAFLSLLRPQNPFSLSPLSSPPLPPFSVLTPLPRGRRAQVPFFRRGFFAHARAPPDNLFLFSLKVLHGRPTPVSRRKMSAIFASDVFSLGSNT